jgi:hypothetical protein
MTKSGTIGNLLLKPRMLPRADKLRVTQFLVSELAKDEGLLLSEQESDYPHACGPSIRGHHS